MGNPGPRAPAGPAAAPLTTFRVHEPNPKPAPGLCPRSSPAWNPLPPVFPEHTSFPRLSLSSRATASAQMSAVTGLSYVKHREQGLALTDAQKVQIKCRR